MDYNTNRPKLILPEYGRNIHKMVNFLKTIEDRDERNKQANVVIGVMSSLSPQIKNREEMAQRLWTQLLIMAEFDLDVDIPVDIPPQNEIFDKPKSVPYPKTKIKTRHYGHNIDLLIGQIDNYKDDELYQYVEQLLNQMKKLYINWNKDLVADDIIKKEFKRLSGKDFDFIDKITLEDVRLPKHNNNTKKRKQKRR
jgi:hypothetical protein